MSNNKVYVKAQGANIAPNTFFLMPRYYKYYNSYNKVVNNHTIVSVLDDTRQLVIEDCVTKMEQSQAREITQQEFEQKFNEHLAFLTKVQNNEVEDEEEYREGWEDIDAHCRYSTNERI